MDFKKALIPAKIIKRYKRFLADVVLHTGEILTVHVANTGRMTTCWEEGWNILISDSENPKRKHRYSLEMTHNGDTWIGINTAVPNVLAAEGIFSGKIKELQGYTSLKREVKYGENSRIDLLLENETETCFVEVKNVTLAEHNVAYFPDAVSERGQKHLRELSEMKKEGHRAVMLFIVQREDARSFEPATHIDPKYTEELYSAIKHGVEVLVYQCQLTPEKIELSHPILNVNLGSV